MCQLTQLLPRAASGDAFQHQLQSLELSLQVMTYKTLAAWPERAAKQPRSASDVPTASSPVSVAGSGLRLLAVKASCTC